MSAILDIETIAMPEQEIRALLPKFDPSAVKIPGNISKPETIAKYVADAESIYGNDIVEKAALSSRYGRIAVIGVMSDKKITQFHSGSESDNLSDAWAYLESITLSNGLIIGYCIKTFDLPFMIRRSFALNVQVPSNIWRPMRYGFANCVVDLAEVWQMGGREYTKLDDVLSELGLPKKTGSGKNFGELWENDRKAALEYNANDLAVENGLAERLGI